MSKEKHFKKLLDIYDIAPIHSFYKDIKLEVRELEATITLPVQSTFFHGGLAVHGSVYFKLLDDAAYFAVQSEVEDYFIVTTQFDIQLLRPVNSGILRAEGKAYFIAQNLFAGSAEIYDDKDRLIAKGQGQFMKSKLPLSKV